MPAGFRQLRQLRQLRVRAERPSRHGGCRHGLHGLPAGAGSPEAPNVRARVEVSIPGRRLVPRGRQSRRGVPRPPGSPGRLEAAGRSPGRLVPRGRQSRRVVPRPPGSPGRAEAFFFSPPCRSKAGCVPGAVIRPPSTARRPTTAGCAGKSTGRAVPPEPRLWVPIGVPSGVPFRAPGAGGPAGGLLAKARGVRSVRSPSSGYLSGYHPGYLSELRRRGGALWRPPVAAGGGLQSG